MSRSHRKLLVTPVVLALLFAACGGDEPAGQTDAAADVLADGDAADDLSTTELPPFSGTGTIAGQVLSPLDGNLLPVGRARVWIEGGPSTVADATGTFRLDEVDADEAVVVHAAGPTWAARHPASRIIYSSTQLTVPLREDQTVSVFPRLVLGCTWSFDAADGAEIDLEQCGGGGGIVISVPGDAFEDSAGESVDGSVRLEIIVLDPDDGAQWAALPDDGLAPDDPDRLELLGAAEFRAIELATGQEVQIASGTAISISVPLAENPDGVGDDELDWYWFDEDTSEWTEQTEGDVVEDDGRWFETEAVHFSFGAVGVAPIDGAALACLNIRPRLQEIEYPCADATDCPDGPDGRSRTCHASGVCGCASDLHCPNDQVCGGDGLCEDAPACDSDTACRVGLDGRELTCREGVCGCRNDGQCAGDLSCVEGRCHQLNANVDVFVDGRHWARFNGTRDCHYVPHGRDLHIEIRYLNPLAIVTGIAPIFEWISGQIRLPRIPNEDLQVPEGLSRTPLEWACTNSASCTPLTDSSTGRRPLLQPQQRSSVSGRLTAGCGADCEAPVEGVVHVRLDGDVVGVGLADDTGKFCAESFLGASSLELTQGFEYPVGNYFSVDFTPSGGAGQRCPDPLDNDWPNGSCQDLGETLTQCVGGDCLRASFELEAVPVADGQFQLVMDASASRGPVVYYE